MGLAIQVGMLADQVENDEEGAEQFESQFALVNEILAKHCHATWTEPRELPESRRCSFDMIGYSGLHYLRRIAAHIDLRDEIPPPGEEKASDDPILAKYFQLADARKPNFLTRMFSGGKSTAKDRKRTFDHLILHSDCEGFYVPVAFPDVILTDDDEISGGMIGSSHVLADECRRLARALELPEGIDPESEELWSAADAQGEGSVTWQRYGIESFTCARLLRAAEMSIASSSAIVFC